MSTGMHNWREEGIVVEGVDPGMDLRHRVTCFLGMHRTLPELLRKECDCGLEFEYWERKCFVRMRLAGNCARMVQDYKAAEGYKCEGCEECKGWVQRRHKPRWMLKRGSNR